MRLLLIRHGETDWNVEARIQGVTDTPLNAAGQRQAALLGEGLRGERLAAIYASPLQRARHTAEAVAAHQSLPVHTHPGLSELDQGILEGLLASELREHPAGVWQAWSAGDLSIVIPGGESLEMLQRRAWDAIQEIQRAVPAEATVAVVSHNLTTKVILCAALGLPLGFYRRLRKDNCSVSTIDLRAEPAILVRLNDISHYANAPEPSGAAAASAP